MPEDFLDRRERMFGREPDVHAIVDRARTFGVTAVVGRPLMGKSWTLTEVARRLVEEQRFLVGFYESKGLEQNNLLFAVADLYKRWLTNSTMRQQALSLWQRHRESILPWAGKMVGFLFEKLAAKSLHAEGIGSVVRAAFDTLADAQKDLLTGGLSLPPNPYEQAQLLVELVGQISGCRVVLVLDAWEKSTSLRSDAGLLDGILKHPEQWDNAHVLLGIRSPEVSASEICDEASDRVRDLCKVHNGRAKLYELSQFSLSNDREKSRMISYVKTNIPAAREESDEPLAAMIDGFPGVIAFWADQAFLNDVKTAKDLQRKASDAHALRYWDLESKISKLTDASDRELAARLAFAPRLDRDMWDEAGKAFLREIPLTRVDALVDAGVLVDDRIPSYGHDTRHAAARNWFLKNCRPQSRRAVATSIESLASQVTDLDGHNTIFKLIVGYATLANEFGADERTQCLINGAKIVLGDLDACKTKEFDSVFRTLPHHSQLLAPFIARALIVRARLRSPPDNFGARLDCSEIIKVSSLKMEFLSAALVSRAWARFDLYELDDAMQDVNRVVELPGAPTVDVAGALKLSARIKGSRNDLSGQLEDYGKILSLPAIPWYTIRMTHLFRATIKEKLWDIDGVIEEYEAIARGPRFEYANESYVEFAEKRIAELKSRKRP